MKKTISYCIWLSAGAYWLTNGGECSMHATLMMLVGIIAGFLVLCLPDGLEGLDGMNDLSDRNKK